MCAERVVVQDHAECIRWKGIVARNLFHSELITQRGLRKIPLTDHNSPLVALIRDVIGAVFENVLLMTEVSNWPVMDILAKRI